MRLYSGYLKHIVRCGALFVTAVAINGCSFSDSSKSISDSTSSIVSSPSSVSGKDDKYQDEIADYTMAYVKSSKSYDDFNVFLRGLSDIAEKEGVTDWEQNEATYVGIGEGLKKAHIDGVAYETYKNNIAGEDVQKRLNIKKGYDSID